MFYRIFDYQHISARVQEPFRTKVQVLMKSEILSESLQSPSNLPLSERAPPVLQAYSFRGTKNYSSIDYYYSA